MSRLFLKTLFLGVLITAVGAGCSTGGAAREPTIKEHGKYVVEYRGSDLTVELSHRWADRSLGDEWMVLALTLTGSGGPEGRVDLDDISLRTPAGYNLVPITRDEFRNNFGRLRSDIRRSDAWNLPSETYGGVRQPCDRWFYAPPGELGHKTLYMTPSQVCFGPMVFQVPGGIQPGPYVFIIDMEESDIRIPFSIEDETVVR
jgi:hypothetical protein